MLTATLKDVTMGRKHVVYFTVGHGEVDVKATGDMGFAFFGRTLEGENFAVQTLDLDQAKRVPRTARHSSSPGRRPRSPPKRCRPCSLI